MSLLAVSSRRLAVSERLSGADWSRIEADLDARGYALLPALLEPQECIALARSYDQDSLFRSRVIMARHGFGRGEYRYFCYPLPEAIGALRTHLYAHLQVLANRWNQRLGVDGRYPAEHGEYLDRCHRAGQRRPTPLLLKYAQGDYNCLHQDLYGQHLFPLQAAVLLSRPGEDFDGGEFILTEQRPRRQSRAQVVPLMQGDGVIFAVNQRPVQGARGFYRVKMRHGVSEVRAGQRYTAGIIFHDAE